MRVSWMERRTNEWVLKTIKPEWTQESRVTGAFTVFWTCGETPRAREERAMENDVMIGVIEKAQHEMGHQRTSKMEKCYVQRMSSRVENDSTALTPPNRNASNVEHPFQEI